MSELQTEDEDSCILVHFLLFTFLHWVMDYAHIIAEPSFGSGVEVFVYRYGVWVGV